MMCNLRFDGDAIWKQDYNSCIVVSSILFLHVVLWDQRKNIFGGKSFSKQLSFGNMIIELGKMTVVFHIS